MSSLLSVGETPFADNRNLEGWQFTWEAQSHTTTLRLMLFRSNTNPSTQCGQLQIRLFSERYLLIVSFFERVDAEVQTSVRVPVPRVFVDPETPIHFTAFEDHIAVNLVLLLPVSHPLVYDVDSICLEENKQDFLEDSDLKKLSGMDEVHFYCRSCSTKLTKGFRHFSEMPSVNWRDVADNWFGSCCCSFGVETEKLVTKYAKSYMCAEGVCLLNTTSVLLCKNDILGFEFPDMDKQLFEHELNSSGYSCLNRVLPEDTTSQDLKIREEFIEDVLGANTGTNFLSAEEKAPAYEGHNPLQHSIKDFDLPGKRTLKDIVGDYCLSSPFPALQINENEGQMNGTHENRKINVENCNSRCCPHLFSNILLYPKGNTPWKGCFRVNCLKARRMNYHSGQ